MTFLACASLSAIGCGAHDHSANAGGGAGDGADRGAVASNDVKAAEFGPAGTVFAVPVRLELPYRAPQGAAPKRIYVQVVEGDGTRAQLVAQVEGPVVVTEIHGFTTFQPAGAQEA